MSFQHPVRFLWGLIVMLACGCEFSKPPAAKTAEKPAKTSYPVAEAQLNTIELTEDAVRRLGLVFATVEEAFLTSSTRDIQPIRAVIKGTPVKLKVCTSCIKAGKVQRVVG